MKCRSTTQVQLWIMDDSSSNRAERRSCINKQKFVVYLLAWDTQILVRTFSHINLSVPVCWGQTNKKHDNDNRMVEPQNKLRYTMLYTDNAPPIFIQLRQRHIKNLETSSRCTQHQSHRCDPALCWDTPISTDIFADKNSECPR